MAGLSFPGTTVLDAAALRARVQRRSYWRLRYCDGRVVNEWECDWSLAPYRGRQALRLYCPNGQVAELGNSQDATGRLFQLHGGLLLGDEQRTVYQLIGLIDGTDGQCQCAAWDYRLGRLRTFRDNVHAMKYEQIGMLSPDVLGIKVD